MKHVFGPVTSRRLGRSLGIDPIPLKTCNWNCIYCQLGRSRPLVNDRDDYFPPEQIIAELDRFLTAHAGAEIDWLTFVGSGETLLHASLGRMIRRAQALSELPVAVITNGSLLYRPEVREELASADAVLPSLDAGNAELYRRINRPHPEITFDRLLDGLSAFRQEYTGRIWLEVMLIRGLNDGEAALRELAARLRRIGPDEIHINQPTRPTGEAWLDAPDDASLSRATTILADVAPLRVAVPVDASVDLSGCDDVADALVAIITRHPLREDELVQALRRWAPQRIRETLAQLEASGRAQLVERHGTRFWAAAPAFFPDSTAAAEAAAEPSGGSSQEPGRGPADGSRTRTTERERH